MRLPRLLAALAIALGTVVPPASAADPAGAKDHPLLSRFKGAEIKDYRASDFDEAVLIVKAIADDDKVPPDAVLTLEGKVTRIGYRVEGSKTSLEVMRNYEEALARGDFKTVFKCSDDATCGGDLGAYLALSGKLMPPGFDATFGQRNRYLLAKRSSAQGDVYALLYVMQDESNQRVLVYQQVVEVKPMATGQVQVLDAASMKKGLEAEGRVAVYGVYFDTAKADVKPESKASLDEMTKLLHGNPALKVYIVGHTDNAGSLAANLDLSQRRADAVVKALVAARIDASRLVAKGVASLAPVASNADEPGRARNRRVELVVQ